MPNKLPTNKESIFYLNVLDIPPNSPEQEGKNALKFAMQNRIKLFYRPAGIAPVNKVTFKKLLVNRSGNGLVIKNDSANWVTISDVKANNVKVNYETIMIAPFHKIHHLRTEHKRVSCRKFHIFHYCPIDLVIDFRT